MYQLRGCWFFSLEQTQEHSYTLHAHGFHSVNVTPAFWASVLPRSSPGKLSNEHAAKLSPASHSSVRKKCKAEMLSLTQTCSKRMCDTHVNQQLMHGQHLYNR